eukprot:3933551-Pyramimonas_sp.AAC.1
MIKVAWAGYIHMDGDLVNREKGEHKKRATEAFGNPMFWGFIELLYVFSDLLSHVNNWAMSCSCHPAARCEEADIVAERTLCNMRGRRVAEITCGGFEKFIDQASELSLGSLVAELAGQPDTVAATIVA